MPLDSAQNTTLFKEVTQLKEKMIIYEYKDSCHNNIIDML